LPRNEGENEKKISKFYFVKIFKIETKSFPLEKKIKKKIFSSYDPTKKGKFYLFLIFIKMIYLDIVQIRLKHLAYAVDSKQQKHIDKLYCPIQLIIDLEERASSRVIFQWDWIRISV